MLVDSPFLFAKQIDGKTALRSPLPLFRGGFDGDGKSYRAPPPPLSSISLRALLFLFFPSIRLRNVGTIKAASPAPFSHGRGISSFLVGPLRGGLSKEVLLPPFPFPFPKGTQRRFFFFFEGLFVCDMGIIGLVGYDPFPLPFFSYVSVEDVLAFSLPLFSSPLQSAIHSRRSREFDRPSLFSFL